MFHNQINEKIAVIINDFETAVDVHGMRKPFLSNKIAPVQGKNVTASNEIRFIVSINKFHNRMH
mgnify:FL=1